MKENPSKMLMFYNFGRMKVNFYETFRTFDRIPNHLILF